MRLKTARGRLFLLLLLLLALPMAQGKFRFIGEWDLKGDIRNTPRPVFSWSSWWNGDYQEKMNDHLNDSVGCRTYLVRANNQLDYALFGKLHANGVVMGRNHCLYEQGYIDEYCGRVYAGYDFARDRLVKLKFIQDTLERLGKKLIVVYAPSKARFYPEYLPKDQVCPVPGRSNYDEFLHIGDSLHIRQIDFNGWVLRQKEKYKHKQLLMSLQGTHWSVFTALLATDSLQRYMEKELNIDMPDLSWKINDDSYSTEARNADADIANGLNLLMPVTTEKFCYPEVIVKEDSTKKKPNVIYIADSFFWVVLSNNIVQRTHNTWQYWYYFNDVWGTKAGTGPMIHVRETNWIDDVVKADCVVLMYTECNIRDLGSGFVDAAYDHFTGKDKK